MGRVFLPQFKHHKNATVLDHAVDAERLDAAFSEVANCLNGGIDESNLADSTKFSAFSAAGAVATAIRPAYSLVTLRGHLLGSRYTAAGHYILMGHLPASHYFTLYKASIRGIDTSGAGTFHISMGSSMVSYTQYGTGYSLSYSQRDATTYDCTGAYPKSPWPEIVGGMVWAVIPSTCTKVVVEAVFKVRVSA